MTERKPKKRLKLRIILSLSMILILGGLGIFLFRQRVTKFAVEVFLSSRLGTKVSMNKFQLNIALGHLNIEGLKIRNPPGFSDNILLDIPKIAVKFDPILFTTGRLYSSHADIHLKSLLIEKDKQGRMNVDSLEISHKAKPAPVFRISLLDLQINQVIERDYRYPKPFIRGHDLNIKKSYRNITGINQLILLMLADPLKEAGLKGAKIFGFYAILGTPLAIPLVVAVDSMGKGNVRKDIKIPLDNLYKLTLKVLDDLGDIKRHNIDKGYIYAKIHGASVNAQLKQKTKDETSISITAKWLFFPEHEVASGILYEIIEQSDKAKKGSIFAR
ncbi:MAG: hypothetical protein WC293_02655 [Candidatus Omnitrophota bacterium]|jgi:hypothetical protein